MNYRDKERRNTAHVPSHEKNDENKVKVYKFQTKSIERVLVMNGKEDI